MKTYARIETGIVAELFQTADDIAALFHPSLLWVEVDPAQVRVGMRASHASGAWVFAAPAPVAPAIPSSVSPAQARLALLSAGKLAQVESIVAAADTATQIAWNNASVIERASPTVAALSAALGLTDAQLDTLFTTAAAIRV